MFFSSLKKLRDTIARADILGDPPAVEAHPHRKPIRLQLERRPGAVAPPPAHCLSPVRSASASRRAKATR